MTIEPQTTSSLPEPAQASAPQERSAFDKARDFLLGYPDGKPVSASPAAETIPTTPAESPMPAEPVPSPTPTTVPEPVPGEPIPADPTPTEPTPTEPSPQPPEPRI